MGTHEIQHLVGQYGCLLVFVAVALQAFGLPLPGTTALVAAAVYAAAGHGLPIEGVIAAGASAPSSGLVPGSPWGAGAAKASCSASGRACGSAPSAFRSSGPRFAAHGTGLLFISRFVTGLRNVAGLVAGASGMSFRRFLPISAAAAVAWASLNALEYYWFGHALLGASTWVRVALICAGIAWLVVSLGLLRRRALRHLRAAPVTARSN